MVRLLRRIQIIVQRYKKKIDISKFFCKKKQKNRYSSFFCEKIWIIHNRLYIIE